MGDQETTEFYEHLRSSNIKLVKRALCHINALNTRIGELERNTAPGRPKFGAGVLFSLVRATQSNEELRVVINMIDRLWRDNEASLEEGDWPNLSALVAKLKARFDAEASRTPESSLSSSAATVI